MTVAPIAELVSALAPCGDGFAFVAGATMHALLGGDTALADWSAFAASWDDLHLDRYMADGGRYRRRRHALYAAPARGAILRKPHGPHWQSLDYNVLNGGIERWFEPIDDAIGASRSVTTILAWCRDVFGAVSTSVAAWDVEVHQFRIEARTDELAEPTPEGVHRDGVDHVLVLLVERKNIASGTTTIHHADGTELGSFTLTAPLDAALVDDRRLSHGVTAVEPLDPTQPAYRDVLVVTFRAAAAR
ncbi:MAG: 2OG-Fe dioxygenase family protein [Deltaproteobacteria bacterium]|nr:2OG-Fe dioxygenase family protein [Deltaproteobacteria bacterium]